MTKGEVQTAGPFCNARCMRCRNRIIDGEKFTIHDATRSQRIKSPTAIYYRHAGPCPSGLTKKGGAS